MLEKIKLFVGDMVEKVRGFSAKDLAIYKLCLVSVGVLFGMSLGKKGSRCEPFFLLTFLGSLGALLFGMYGREKLDSAQEPDDAIYDEM